MVNRFARRFSAMAFGVASAVILAGLMALPAAAADVTGKVLGPAGKPVPGAQIELEDTMKGAVSGADGTFTISGVRPDTYALRVTSFGLAAFHQTVTVTDQAPAVLEITLAPNAMMAKDAAAYQPPKPERLNEAKAYLEKIASLPPKAKRPNILLVLYDDLGAGDLGVTGNRLIKTPVADRIAQSGLMLTEAYSPNPVCTPSRAGLMTGRYPQRAMAANHVFFPSGNPVAGFRRSQGFANALPTDEILLPEVLKAAGYRTGIFGKWHLGDQPGTRPHERGFDRFDGVLYSNDMAPLALMANGDVAIPPDQLKQADLSRHFADAAIRFIEGGTGPFFAYVPFTAPHYPHVPPADRAGKSAGGTYGDVVEEADAQLGRIIAALEKKGVLKDTLIIVTSDNGADQEGSSGPLRGRKQESYEGGMRVPFILSWPGQVPAGKKLSGMTMLTDIFPTLLTLLDLPLPADRVVDGRNQWALWTGRGKSAQSYLFYSNAWTGKIEAVRNERFKLRDRTVEPFANPFFPAEFPLQPMRPRGLFDLALDAEAHSVANIHPEIMKDLDKALGDFRAALAANPRGWLPAPAPRATP